MRLFCKRFVVLFIICSFSLVFFFEKSYADNLVLTPTQQEILDDFEYYKENGKLKSNYSLLNIEEFNEIGRAFNIFSAEYGRADNVIISSSVFDVNWLDQQIIKRQNLRYSYNDVIYGYSKSSYIYMMHDQFQLDANIKGRYKLFKGSIDASFDSKWYEEGESSTYSFFYTSLFKYTSHRLFWDNINGPINNAKLDNRLLDYLEVFLYQLPEYEVDHYINFLFLTFGTHIITSGTYGAEVSVNYSSYSDTIQYDNYNKSNALADLEASIIPTVSGGVTVQNSFESFLDSESKDHKTVFKANAKGGNTLSINSFAETAEKTDAWVQTIEGKETLISYDSFKPIWELLPDYYQHDIIGNMNLKYLKSSMNRVFNNQLDV